ncbi:MAG: 8-oxo-dGTP diphosphatase [Candidatus Magasanikbacteria bacterium]|nr:8-oxo-dGTP diphosphatase [Candidatus Magasanikbacteria bacterium]
MEYSFPNGSNLVYLLRGADEVLLIMKKRDFGQGKWNGPGGKVTAGEDLIAAAQRELTEETGYIAAYLQPAGFIEFVWPEDKKGWNQRCHIYTCRQFSGALRESEECLPQWFKFSQIPFDQMWEDDQHWLMDVLRGGVVQKRFFFDGESKIVKIEEVSSKH